MIYVISSTDTPACSPRLTETRQSAVTVFGSGSGVFENFTAFLRILVSQSDGLSFNSIPAGGLYYFFGLPLALVGLFSALASRKDFKAERPMLLALAASFISAFFIVPNINRVNMVMLPLVYFSALGLYRIARRIGDWLIAPIALVLVCFGVFVNSYFRDFPRRASEIYYEGLGEAIVYAESLEPERVYVSYHAQQPYIFVLFYTETPPEEFYSTVRYMNPDGAFRWVYGFGKYTFGYGADESGESDVMVLHFSEAEDSEVLASFGNYCVCKRK